MKDCESGWRSRETVVGAAYGLGIGGRAGIFG